MNILLVHNRYKIAGGEDTVYENEAALLEEKGHQVIRYEKSNDELDDMSLPEKLFLPLNVIFNLKTYIDIRRIIKDKNIEMVHCHNTLLLISPAVYYAAQSMRVPVVQTIHNFRLLCPNGTFYYDGNICEKCQESCSFKAAVKRGCYRGSKLQTIAVAAMLSLHRRTGIYRKIAYIFLTDFNRRRFAGLIDVNADNVFVKPNFVDAFKRTSRMYSHEKRFIFAGRLDESKGIKVLLDMWNRLPDDNKLYIYGKGPLEQYVKDFILQKSPENIIFKGFAAHEEILEELLSAKALVFPSLWYEGFPMIIAEALAAGCPVLTADIGNHADIVKAAKGGAVYSPDSYESFINAVEDIISNNEQYSESAIQYYEKELSKEKNYERLMEIYKVMQKSF